MLEVSINFFWDLLDSISKKFSLVDDDHLKRNNFRYLQNFKIEIEI